MRPVRLIAALGVAATVGILMLPAGPAWAAPTTPPFTVHANPNPVVAGHAVTLSGSVGSEAAASDCDYLVMFSAAFTVTNDPTMAPVTTTAKPSGSFSATATVPQAKPAGTYPIYLRCGGAPVGGGRLVVQAASPSLQASPSSVMAGHTVTVSGWLPPAPADSACATAVTLLSNAFVRTYDFADVPAVSAAVKPDGTFAVTTRIPRSRAAGTYTITGRCGGGNLGASATLVVRAAPPPTTTATPAPPAPPVTRSQTPAAAVAVAPAIAGPATSAAARPASRWIVPGIAALGASTLAGLGIWLLYRRRHLTNLGR